MAQVDIVKFKVTNPKPDEEFGFALYGLKGNRWVRIKYNKKLFTKHEMDLIMIHLFDGTLVVREEKFLCFKKYILTKKEEC